MIADWIFEDNLEPFVLTMGDILGHAVDADDLATIEQAIERTDGDESIWFDYQLGVEKSVVLSFAKDSGTAVIQVRLVFPANFENQIRTAIGIFQRFHVQ